MKGLTDRLFRLVDLLQGDKKVTTEELALSLSVSERTVRRDIARLQDLELPVEVVPGRGGGASLAPGSLLPALRFTDDEALALGYGLLLARRSGSVALEQATRSALARLSNALGGRLQERLEALTTALAELPTEPQKRVLASSLILDLAEAVKAKRRADLGYRSRQGEVTTRRVDPYGLVHLEHFWYVTGYCHLRRAVRIFRLDRVRHINLTRETFSVPEAFDPLQVVTAAIATTPFPGTVTCRVRLNCTVAEASRLVPLAAAMLVPKEHGVLITVHHPLDALEQLALYLLGFSFEVEVLEPPELRAAFVAVAERALGLAGQQA